MEKRCERVCARLVRVICVYVCKGSLSAIKISAHRERMCVASQVLLDRGHIASFDFANGHVLGARKSRLKFVRSHENRRKLSTDVMWFCVFFCRSSSSSLLLFWVQSFCFALFAFDERQTFVVCSVISCHLMLFTLLQLCVSLAHFDFPVMAMRINEWLDGEWQTEKFIRIHLCIILREISYFVDKYVYREWQRRWVNEKTSNHHALRSDDDGTENTFSTRREKSFN